jgi:hypothetical protein
MEQPLSHASEVLRPVQTARMGVAGASAKNASYRARGGASQVSGPGGGAEKNQFSMPVKSSENIKLSR